MIEPIAYSNEILSAMLRQPILVSPETPLLEAIDLMNQGLKVCSIGNPGSEMSSSCCILVMANDKLLGIFTTRDLLALVSTAASLDSLQMRQVMVSPVLTLRLTDCPDVFAAMRFLQQHKFRQAPVLDANNHILGLIDRSALIENEALFSELSSASPVGIFRTDPMGSYLYVNKRCCEILGISPAQALGEGWMQAIHPDDRATVVAQWQSVVQESRTFQLEYRFQKPSGEVTWVYGQAQAEYSADKVVGYVGTLMNISDRKQAEENRLQAMLLRRELRLIETMLDNIFAGYWDWNIVQNTEYFSPGFLKMLGYDEQDPLPSTPQTWRNLLLKEDLPLIQTKLDEHFNSGGAVPFCVEARYQHKSGQIIWVICSGQVIKWDEQQSPLRMIGCHFNITQRKLAEEQSKQLSDRLALAIKSAELGIWEYNLQDKSLLWSDRTYELYGLSRDQKPLTLQSCYERVHPDDRSLVEHTFQKVLTQPGPYQVEYRIIRPDGQVRYLVSSAMVVPNSATEHRRMLGIHYDITYQKQTELTLIKTTQQLAAMNEELEAFSYSVSHDLRAPLRHISGFVNALGHQLEQYPEFQDPKVAHYLQIIENSSNKMALLIDGLLMLSRSGRKTMEFKSVNLNALVREVIAIVKHGIDRDRPPIEFVVGELPTIRADLTLMRQVIQNLIENSVKFTRDTPHPRIEIQSEPNGTIWIKDNGAGFQMDYVDKLFSAFQRLHAQSEFEGTGIGLALVKRIIKRHGGIIWAEGERNKGATFYFKIES